MTIGGEIKAVSFDVFDTLVVRNVAVPEDVFTLVEYQYNQRHPDKCLDDFKMQRIKAEGNLRKYRQSVGQMPEEVTFDEIYQVLFPIYTEETEELKKLEIETELSICVPNQEMLAYFTQFLEKGLAVFLISDMYLPAKVIEEILDKCGVKGYRKLYVSSELGMTKRYGKLFEVVLKENQFVAKEMLHIGDHLIADYQMPRKFGMNAFLYQKKILFPFS